MKVTHTKTTPDTFSAEIDKVTAFGIFMYCIFECVYHVEYDEDEIYIHLYSEDCNFDVGDAHHVHVDKPWHDAFFGQVSEDVKNEIHQWNMDQAGLS